MVGSVGVVDGECVGVEAVGMGMGRTEGANVVLAVGDEGSS